MTGYYTSLQVYDGSVLKYSNLFYSTNNISSASRITNRTFILNKPTPKILMKPRLCSQSTHDMCLFLGISEFLGFRHPFDTLAATGACAGDRLEGEGLTFKDVSAWALAGVPLGVPKEFGRWNAAVLCKDVSSCLNSSDGRCWEGTTANHSQTIPSPFWEKLMSWFIFAWGSAHVSLLFYASAQEEVLCFLSPRTRSLQSHAGLNTIWPMVEIWNPFACSSTAFKACQQYCGKPGKN